MRTLALILVLTVSGTLIQAREGWQKFDATAYSREGQTASGQVTREGKTAAAWWSPRCSSSGPGAAGVSMAWMTAVMAAPRPASTGSPPGRPRGRGSRRSSHSCSALGQPPLVAARLRGPAAMAGESDRR